MTKATIFFCGPLLGMLVYTAMISTGWPFAPAFTAAVTILCACWWMTEAIPIPATALIPLSVLPLAGVLSREDVTGAFGNPIHFLLLGGFILSLAMVNSGAHLRIATGMLRLVKTPTSRNLVLAFMATSAFLSMWISNAATTLMLLPAALAVLDSAKNRQVLTVPLLLGICYAASVGGIGTPIGTPPNLIFMANYQQVTGKEISFLQWMQWGLPVVICLLPIVAWKLTRGLTTVEPVEIENRGQWQPAEWRLLLIYLITVLLWITRKDPYGGWSEWLNMPNAHDGYVALIASVAVFIVPDGKGKTLMDWETTAKLPWGIIVLVAGGLALSTAMKNTGLIEGIARQLGGLSGLSSLYLILAICLVVTFLTELTSNSASTALLMPVLAAAAAAAGVDPMLMMLPAAISASCAFMMPMATGPNAIIFGTERVSIGDMMREGIVLNILCALALAGVMFVISMALNTSFKPLTLRSGNCG